ncbi:toxin glutamine deamidase domain-containing protein [Nocardiopsis sp. NPDC058631]
MWGTTGHAFNVRNNEGHVVFLDAQRGVADHADRWRYYYLIRGN